MKTIKPLIETNPFLKDPVERHKRIARSVRTSCAVEGIRESKSSPKAIQIKSRVPKKIYNAN